MNVDVVIVGSGSAAQSVAYPCRAGGRTVAVVDSRPYGGTCALRGCDPKKVLVGVSEVIDWGRRMEGSGVASPAPSFDWHDMMRFKRTFVDQVPEAVEDGLRAAGIATVHGRARFVAPTSLRVGNETVTGRHVVIAAGARHAPLGIKGEELLTKSSGFLELDQLPRRVVFVGGGYIAFEFAHIAVRAGAHVEIVHRGPRPLEAFDADLVDRLVEKTRELGVEVHLNAAVTGVEEDKGGLVVRVRSEERAWQVTGDLVVHAAGRVPEIDDLALDVGGVARAENGGVAVNEYLQSVSNPAVYAAGDAAASGNLPFTPVAGMQGQIVASNLLEGNTRTPNYEGIPSVVFTTPTLARVGLTESAARLQGIPVVVKSEDTSGWYTSRRVRLSKTGFKTLVEEGTGRLVGAHVLGPHAEEVINVFGLALRHGLRAADLTEMVYSYPTSGSDIIYMV